MTGKGKSSIAPQPQVEDPTVFGKLTGAEQRDMLFALVDPETEWEEYCEGQWQSTLAPQFDPNAAYRIKPLRYRVFGASIIIDGTEFVGSYVVEGGVIDVDTVFIKPNED